MVRAVLVDEDVFNSGIVKVKLFRIPRVRIYEGQEIDIHFKQGLLK